MYIEQTYNIYSIYEEALYRSTSFFRMLFVVVDFVLLSLNFICCLKTKRETTTSYGIPFTTRATIKSHAHFNTQHIRIHVYIQYTFLLTLTHINTMPYYVFLQFFFSPHAVHFVILYIENFGH